MTKIRQHAKSHHLVHVPVITIDGPTASGKGTVAQRVATALGFHYLDSGALYRLTALASLRQQIGVDNVEALVQLVGALDIVFKEGCIKLDGVDVSHQIRAEDVGVRASEIAVYEPVRAALVARQRAFRLPPGLVADGRDMGTVIFPDADLKIFLSASVQTRAQRRYKQLIEKGFSASMGALLQDLQARDARDSGRAVAPLRAAQGAKMLDTSELCIDESVTTVMQWFKELTEHQAKETLN